MAMEYLVGTESGLWRLREDVLEPMDALTGRSITALTREGARAWAIVEGRGLWRGGPGAEWRELHPIEGPEATCLAATPDGLLIGTEEAHLLRLTDAGLARIESFDTAEGRADWYTPWGDPADVRSIAVDADGTIYVNVHVGGVVRSRDNGRSWSPTLDIEVDVHQVLVHPTRPGVVLVAAAAGFGVSRDGGASWRFTADGFHAHYLRAVAIGDDTVFVSASTGPGGRSATVYRAPLEGDVRFTRCAEGLPRWFGDNVDTGCLVAAGSVVMLGTEDGRLFRSVDAGARWELVAKGLPAVRALAPSGGPA